MADLNDLLAIKPVPVDVPIYYPGTENPVGLTITVVSYDDERVKTISRRITDARLKLAGRGKNFTAEQLEENQMNLLLAASIGWEWTDDYEGNPGNIGGQQPEFSRDAIRKVYELDWIKEQVLAALEDKARFFQK